MDTNTNKQRQIFKSGNIEFCSLLNSKKTPSNPVYKIFFSTLATTLLKDLKCPLTGRFDLEKFAENRAVTNFLPSGTYHLVVIANITAVDGVKDFANVTFDTFRYDE